MIDLRKWRPLSKEGKQVWNEMKAEARALGHREGFEDGFEKAQFEALTEVLTVRFGALSAATKRRVASLDAERMPQLLRLALSAETLRDFLGALDD